MVFKMLTCPNELACEGKHIYPLYDGEKITRQVDKYTHQMVLNDVCGYIIHAPSKMEERDKLVLKISRIENAEVYVAKGKGYKWINHLDVMATEGIVLDTRMGW